MGSSDGYSSIILFLLYVSTFLLIIPAPAAATSRKLNGLVQQQPLVLNYHNGPLLKGDYTINLVWYGPFSPSQRSIVLDFLASFDKTNDNNTPPPSVSSWWSTTEAYEGGGSTTFTLGKQLLLAGNDKKNLAPLKSADIVRLAGRVDARGARSLTLLLTSADVPVEGFCSSRCGTHGALPGGGGGQYVWVGNSASQCPGQCAWPFHQPIYGPQTPPLVAPNGDVGVDGMIINLATLLAGTVTNPYGNGYFQGPKEAPLEAVSACTGVFGEGAYPGYPGRLLLDRNTGASFNAVGRNGRKYLLPAMWDPKTSQCATLV